jgi:hypothetical protein
MNNSLETLAATSPKNIFHNVRVHNERILTLEAQLGLSPGRPFWNVAKSASRIRELESMLANGKAAPVSLPTGAARVTPGNVATVEQFNALSFAEREVFSENAGAVSVDSFNGLPLAARVKHFEAGGKIAATATDKTVLAERVRDGQPNPRNSGTMSLAAFTRLGKNDQATMLRLGLKLAAK